MNWNEFTHFGWWCTQHVNGTLYHYWGLLIWNQIEKAMQRQQQRHQSRGKARLSNMFWASVYSSEELLHIQQSEIYKKIGKSISSSKNVIFELCYDVKTAFTSLVQKENDNLCDRKKFKYSFKMKNALSRCQKIWSWLITFWQAVSKSCQRYIWQFYMGKKCKKFDKILQIFFVSLISVRM